MCLILDDCWHSSSKPRGTGRHASVGAVLPVHTLCSGMDSFSKKRRNGNSSWSFSTHSTRRPLLEAHVSHFRIFFFPSPTPSSTFCHVHTTQRDLQRQGKPRTWVNPAKVEKTIHPPRKVREPGPPAPVRGFHPPGQQPGHWATERSPVIWNTMGYHTSTLSHDVLFEHQGPQWIPPPPVTPPVVWGLEKP